MGGISDKAFPAREAGFGEQMKAQRVVALSDALDLERRVKELEEGITYVVTQKRDDLCWRDIYIKLSALVGLEFDPDTLPAGRNARKLCPVRG